MAAPLKTTSHLRLLCPDPPATVRIQNLSTTLQHAGHDAWNRPHKPQPCHISAEVSFAAPFSTASANDRLGADTVHYGTLSKAVLGSVGAFEKENAGVEGERGVRSVLERIWGDLTGLGLDGSVVQDQEKKKAFLDLRPVRFLSVTVALPKASLLGEGVRLTASGVFGEEGQMEARALALEVSRLRVPTLVGVNANERLSKQFVIATVVVDGFDLAEDVYTEVEAVVVKALEESSFETLEALGTHLADRVLATKSSQPGWQVHVRMEKPTAVPMADCPIVEVRATRESLNQAAGRD